MIRNAFNRLLPAVLAATLCITAPDLRFYQAAIAAESRTPLNPSDSVRVLKPLGAPAVTPLAPSLNPSPTAPSLEAAGPLVDGPAILGISDVSMQAQTREAGPRPVVALDSLRQVEAELAQPTTLDRLYTGSGGRAGSGEPSAASGREAKASSIKPSPIPGSLPFSNFLPMSIVVQDDGGTIIMGGQFNRSYTAQVRLDHQIASPTHGVFFVATRHLDHSPLPERVMKKKELQQLQTALGKFLRQATGLPEESRNLYQELLQAIGKYLSTRNTPAPVSLHDAAATPVPPHMNIQLNIKKWELEVHSALSKRGFGNLQVKLYVDKPSAHNDGPNVLSVSAALPTGANIRVSPHFLVRQLQEALTSSQAKLSWIASYTWEFSVQNAKGVPTYRNGIPVQGVSLPIDVAKKALSALGNTEITAYSTPGGVPPFAGALVVSKLANTPKLLSMLGKNAWVLYDRSEPTPPLPGGFKKSAQDFYLKWEGAVAE